MTVKLLCAGDIHLGRHPSGLTEEVREGLDERDLRPAAVWESTVRAALDHSVDAVLLAGDVVEQRDDFFEAYRDLRGGVDRLVEAGIDVLGVAGNHDGLVLPRLADAIPAFRLLGRDVEWEFVEIHAADGSSARILGWSFPSEAVHSDPLATAPGWDGADVPTLGLLHCDRDTSGSCYAPVRGADLAGHWADAWFLGHIHKPDDLRGPRPVGYLGAIAALRTSDLGPRGPWLVEAAGRGDVTARQLPLSRLRFSRVDVDVSDLPNAEALQSRLVREIERLGDDISGASHAPMAHGVRFRLVGRSAHRRALGCACAQAHELVRRRGETLCFVQQVTNLVLPARDLTDLAAGGSDPVGLLAARILLLDGDPGVTERKELLRRARASLLEVRAKACYLHIPADGLDDESLAAVLRDSALAAMDELEARREATA